MERKRNFPCTCSVVDPFFVPVLTIFQFQEWL